MRFKVGDYVMRKKAPDFVWQVERIHSRTERGAYAGPPWGRGNKLTLKVVCTLKGKPASDLDVRQIAWESELEQAPAMLVIAWESQ